MRVLLVLLLSTSLTYAHSFYDIECCDDQDCRPAKEGEIKEVNGGYLVVPTNEFFPYKHPKVKFSPDGKYHRCEYILSGFDNFTLCIYVPQPSF